MIRVTHESSIRERLDELGNEVPAAYKFDKVETWKILKKKLEKADRRRLLRKIAVVSCVSICLCSLAFVFYTWFDDRYTTRKTHPANKAVRVNKPIVDSFSVILKPTEKKK